MICPLNVVIVNSYVQLPEGNLNLQYPPHLPLGTKATSHQKNPCLGSGALPVHFTPFSLLSSDPDMEISSLLTPINIFLICWLNPFRIITFGNAIFHHVWDWFSNLSWIIYCFVFYIIVTCSYLFSVVRHMIKSSVPVLNLLLLQWSQYH